MSVTFNRTLLVKVAKQALAEHEQVVKDYDTAVADYVREHAARHAEPTRAKAVELRNALTKALKSSGPVHTKTITRVTGSRYPDSFYNPPGDYDIKQRVSVPKGLLKPAEVAETRALVQVLQAATGDTVSANELKLLGLKNLQPVFVAAAQSINGEASK
jgi:hypothetical protein